MSIFKKTKKIVSGSFIFVILLGLFVPFFSQAETIATTYYHSLLENQNYTIATECATALKAYLQTYVKIPVPDIPCSNTGGSAPFFFPKDTGKKSTTYTEEAKCDKASQEYFLTKYTSILNAYNNLPIEDVNLNKFASYFTCQQAIPVESTTPPAKTELNYYPLAQLPGLGEANCTADSTGKTVCVKMAPNCTVDPKDPKKEICTPARGFGDYLNILINLFIGICAILAMIMIVMGGIQYMTSGLVSSKESAKETITNAILGLLLALGAFAILNTINPDLLSIGLGELPTARVPGPGGDTMPTDTTPSESFKRPVDKTILTNMGITCPESGGQSVLASVGATFVGKSTYSQAHRFSYNPTIPTVYLDCSSFAKQVYRCAGLDFNGTNTVNIFPGAEKITSISGTKVNGIELQVGDLLGWMDGETPYEGGHVVMYYGNGKTIESHGPEEPSKLINKGVSIYPLTTYSTALKHIVRVSSAGQNTTPIGQTKITQVYKYSSPNITTSVEFKNKAAIETIITPTPTGTTYTYKMTVKKRGTNTQKTTTLATIPSYKSLADVGIIATTTATDYLIEIYKTKNNTTPVKLLSGYLSIKK